MALVTSLLTAIVRADGDALVLHAGERPYVVAPQGQTELASRALTLDAMKGMLKELLPAEAQYTLADDGAVQHELAAPGFARGETFTVIAARGGDDIWIEIRRHRAPAAPVAPPAPIAPIAPPAPEFPRAEHIEAAEQVLDADVATQEYEISLDADFTSSDALESAVADLSAVQFDEPAPEPVAPAEHAPDVEAEAPAPPAPVPEMAVELEPAASFELVVEPEPEPESEPDPEPEPEPEPEPRPAIVLPLSRTHLRGEHAGRFSQTAHAPKVDWLLRVAAAHGASTLYLTSQACPSIRVDGEIVAIDGEGVLTESDVEALIFDIMPERNREAQRSQAGTEWICDVPEVGRIRCVTFRDHRGAGGIFRMVPPRAISPEQLGLSPAIQGLLAEDAGLLLVTGPRAGGKSTLLYAFVDLINRTRSDHVITLETQIKFVHDNRLSLVSQREIRGDRSELLAAARAAQREHPDVLVLEDFGSPEIVALGLEAAQAGQLVIGALTAHTATDAVERMVDQTPPERRPKVQLGLAENLRGIVAQVLLRKPAGGRVAAREVLLNTGAVANVIAEGKTSQLPGAIAGGRRHGMVALNEALVALVQSGTVDSREAFRRTADQQGFLAQLERQGLDTSFVERPA